jgi:hypothetical protein
VLARIALAAVCFASLAGCSSAAPNSAGSTGTSVLSSSLSSEARFGPYSGPNFYTPPDPLPDRPHGTLLRYQPAPSRSGAITFRIMYLSESVGGKPIAVTGLVLIPHLPAASKGRPIIALAHGTTGLAGICEPSHDPGENDTGELDLMGPEINAGYLVAATDYEELGAPERQPYLVGVSEGRSVLDAALAGRMVPGSDAGRDVAIAGYSQGGHAALWANQLARSWAPELHVVGTFAGAPAGDLEAAPFAALSSPLSSGLFMMIVAGYQATYPKANPSLVLTAKGIKVMRLVDSECVDTFVANALGLAPAELIKPRATSVEPWAKLLRTNDPGQVATPDPVYIVQSAADNDIPVVVSQQIFERLCAKGQVIDRLVLENGQGHTAAMPGALQDGFTWIQARFDGIPAQSNCPAGR